jgi:hypothetical protein
MTLDRRWEKFSGGPAVSRQEKEMRVTLNRKGMFYLSAKMYALIGRPKAVALYYNRDEDLVAIKPAYERFEEHFKLTKLGSNGWGIRASTFCRHYKIKIPTTERFIRPDLDNEGHLILNLRQTTTVGGITRTKGTGPRTKPPASTSQNREL